MTFSRMGILGFRRARGFLSLVLLICGSTVMAGAWGAVRIQAPSKAAIRERIEVIIRETLKQGERNVNGIRVITRVPPSKQAIQEIKAYGDDAVAVVQEHLDSESGRERHLAMELLGLIGGPRIVQPLRRVILHSKRANDREMALRWITQAPWKEALPTIRQAALTDPEPQVRQLAKRILNNYSPN